VRRAQYPRPAFVPTDLADVGALARNLAAAGFDAARPALFTCEGIFCYLPLARPERGPPPAPAHPLSCPAGATCARSWSPCRAFHVALQMMQGWEKWRSGWLRLARQGRPIPAHASCSMAAGLLARAPGLRECLACRLAAGG